MLEKFSLDGKTAVITGGSGLYGRQMVLALAEAGAEVYNVSRSLEVNEENAKTLRDKGLRVYAGRLDQGDEKSILEFMASLENEGKKVDILVNNAVLRPKGGFWDDASYFDESMHVNATGLFMVTRVFGEHMAERGGGSIINIGSYMGVLGPDFNLYKGTPMDNPKGMLADYFYHKGGMQNFTRFIASYYGEKNIRCNVLNLGGFYNGQDPVFVKRYSDKTFLKRMANETDIMGALVFLASDASAYITGASIPIDGGYIAN